MLVLGPLAAVLDLDVIVDHAALQRPGTIHALVAMTVAEMVGFIRCSRSRMPPLSNWKIPWFRAAQKGERFRVVDGKL